MLQKLGSLHSAKTKSKVILVNTKGEHYQVNFVVAYVWQCLDGRQSPEKIAHTLSREAECSLRKARVTVDAAISALMDIGLVQDH